MPLFPVLLMMLGIGLIVVGGGDGVSGIVLSWAGVGFCLTGAGHFGPGSRIYGKKQNGQLPWWSIAIYFPFLCYTWGIWHLSRIISRERVFDRISDEVLIGRRLLPGEQPAGIVNLVDLTAEFTEPAALWAGKNFVCLPILDGGVPAAPELDAAIAKIKPGLTYIHCAQGHGRTGLFALALLQARGEIADYDAGLARLRAARPALALTRRQELYLRARFAVPGTGVKA